MILQAWNLMWGWKLASQFTVTQISGFGWKILAVCHVHVGSISEFSRMGFFKRKKLLLKLSWIDHSRSEKKVNTKWWRNLPNLQKYATHLNGMVLFLCQSSGWKYTLFEPPPSHWIFNHRFLLDIFPSSSGNWAKVMMITQPPLKFGNTWMSRIKG